MQMRETSRGVDKKLHVNNNAKTACVEGLAQRIVKGNVPAKLKDMNILTLDIGNVVAGSKFRGK